MMSARQENAVEPILEKIMGWSKLHAEGVVFLLTNEHHRHSALADTASSRRLDCLSADLDASSARFATLVALVKVLTDDDEVRK